MATTEDQIVSAGDPYFRVVQPKSPTSAWTASSYFRLGTYVSGAAEEDALVTGLTTTTSSVKNESKSAFDQAGDAIANKKNDPAKKFNATSQASETFTTTASAAIASGNNGVLIYSDSDLHENIKGAALKKVGAGDVVEVTTADAKYAVKAGKYDLSAANGIFVKAGTFDAGGGVKDGANIELTAGGYIKQTAYGDLDEVTYGITTKRFHGIANDFFMGVKNSTFFGLDNSIKLSGTFSVIMSGEATFRLSTRFSLVVSADISITLAAVLNLFVGGKWDFVIGMDYKNVTGWSMKHVAGVDTKVVVADFKTVATTDIKSATLADMKKVGLNMTICDVDLKKEFGSINLGGVGFSKAMMQTRLDDLVVDQTTAASVDMAGIKAFL